VYLSATCVLCIWLQSVFCVYLSATCVLCVFGCSLCIWLQPVFCVYLVAACVLCVFECSLCSVCIGAVHLSLPGRAERVIKGHLGPSEALLRVASSLAGSGIGVWADMDQLVAEGPSLAALRVVCA
jgi:hypothetical protein